MAAGTVARDGGAFDAASAAREPPPRPPVPVKVTWRARRVASIDLGAALLALTAGDLDGDARAELVALTERDVIVLRPTARGLVEVARAALPAEPAAIRPRDPVGAVVIAPGADGRNEVRARASLHGRGGRWVLDGKALRELGPVAAFPLCGDLEAALVPGRNYFAGGAAGAAAPAGPATKDEPAPVFHAVRCRGDVVDRAGRAVRAQVTVEPGGRATVVVETRCGGRDAGCVPRREHRLDGVGVAIELDDVDRDGTLELVTSGAGAPGDADAVAVWTLGDAGPSKKPVFRRGFSGGVVALGSGDVDGDGDRDVFAAVRLAGARKVDLWLLH
ncbi:MAG: hypothetical protein HS111_30900 [Kofleriaceae bacterium]|nr:hypothetical protein [Kofleriaceae bacterium]